MASSGGSPSSLVDSVEAILGLVEVLQLTTAQNSRLYLDLEGVRLSRNGTISIVTIFVEANDHVYLIDVHTLGSVAFTTATGNGTTLKSILEAPNIKKVFFDVRNDSDALHHHFGVLLDGVEDIQLMELASRPPGRKKFVMGLEKCIDNWAPLTLARKQEWKTAKQKGLKLFHPSMGGSYEVFNKRPMPNDILMYCVNDVRFLPQLRDSLWSRVNSSWREKVCKETAMRISQSISPDYQPQSDDKKYGPWGYQ